MANHLEALSGTITTKMIITATMTYFIFPTPPVWDGLQLPEGLCTRSAKAMRRSMKLKMVEEL
ncbi:hypothetical protein CWC28_21800 [Pseudoalteromonas sp. S4492]|nr:hypothetical protein CWC28_21800 [Pseudoalteromonas sp. S4492]